MFFLLNYSSIMLYILKSKSIFLQKAFDCVDHVLLLSKMYKEGDYLENRLQIVQTNGSVSEPCQIKTGVVQGGVVSPTLFDIFVDHSMFDLQLKGIIQMYADESVIKYSAFFLYELLCQLASS
jgi:hypothetical protein